MVSAAPDRAANVAEYLHQSRGVPFVDRRAEIARRWPDISDDEMRRAVDIAQELLRAEAQEHLAIADDLDAIARQRREASK